MSNPALEPTSTHRFSSRWGLLLSVLGIAVGTGNIWRFPRIAAANSGDEGAGMFLIAWFVFLLIWSIPLIIAEYALGRKGRMGVVGTFAQIAGERYAWMGAFVAFVATAIMFYYSVVAGWCMYYFITSVSTDLPISLEASQQTWASFQGSGLPVFFHAVAMLGGAIAVWKGVRSIERVNKVLIPCLFAIVIIAFVRAMTLDGAWEGVRFLFTPDWSTAGNARLWLEALTQNAWDTGAGWGLILTYGAYMHRRQGVVKNAFITGFGNNLVSIVAAVTIFGTVFAILGSQMSQPEVLNIMRDSGPASTGLTFYWMPQLFQQMPGGRIIAILFFLGLSFAAFSSLISMIELATRVFVDFGFSRARAIACVCGSAFVLGVPSAISLDLLGNDHLTILGNQDFVWGVALMISGAFVAFTVARYGVVKFREEAISGGDGDWTVGRGYDLLIRFVVPLQAIVLLFWWLYLSATSYAPDSWYNPLDPYSVATCVVQWGIVLAAFVALNKRLASSSLAHRPIGDE